MGNLVDKIEKGFVKAGLVAVLFGSAVLPTACASEPKIIATYDQLSTGSYVEVIDRRHWGGPNTNRLRANGNPYYVEIADDGVVHLNNYGDVTPSGIVTMYLADYNLDGKIDFSDGEWVKILQRYDDDAIYDTYNQHGLHHVVKKNVIVGKKSGYILGVGGISAPDYDWIIASDEVFNIDDPYAIGEMNRIASDAEIYLKVVYENEWMWPN